MTALRIAVVVLVVLLLSACHPWPEIARCESHSTWDLRNPPYEGGLQFQASTWDRYKLDSYPESAADATPFEQMVVAEAVLAHEGWSAWPSCSRQVGAR